MRVFRSKKDWWLLAFLICMSGLLLQLLLTMQAKGTMAQYPVHPLGLVAGLEYPLYRAGWAVDYQKLVADLANSAWFDSEYPAYRSLRNCTCFVFQAFKS